MRILIAEDDPTSALLLRKALTTWGHELVETNNGQAAFECLQAEHAPRLAILDWMMPGMHGVEVCRRIRALAGLRTPYLILLTSRYEKQDIVAGLDNGADDYLTKPFDRHLLLSRIRVGERILSLQDSLAARVEELEQALVHVKQLKGLVPMCSYCKKIRDDENYWGQVEDYVAKHTDAKFSHAICPNCWHDVVEPGLNELATPAA